MQIRGVGQITALAFVLVIDDPLRFARSRDVGAYLGMCPGQRQSGNRDTQLRITKEGNRYVRSLLVQCAHYILGHFGKDCDLRRQGEALQARGLTSWGERDRPVPEVTASSCLTVSGRDRGCSPPG